MMSPKVQPYHQNKPAYVYIRQSTMGQVRHHQESTERQYALKDKALQMGWQGESIRILDRDLGKSGAQMMGREDFKMLVADVSLGAVGAVFALEASRLARSSLDWHRLIEICAFTSTLVIDEDGCYNPADFNDRLLLGLKAQMAQAELHTIRARLQGGKLNKAMKGELRFPLPVGLCYDDGPRIVIDPDQEVQGAVRLVFELFGESGSAYAVVHQFSKRGLRFPKRAYGGAWDGKLIWGRLSHGRVLGILKNPSYAGTYVFGRHRQAKEITSNGEIHSRTTIVPMEDWKVTMHDHHEGYITWEQFVKNQTLLDKNRTNGESTLLSGAAREGHALLQGLLLCSKCGRRISVRYKGNGGIYPTYDCNALKRDGRATKSCINVRGDLLDEAISNRVLEIIEPAQVELTSQAAAQLEKRDEALSMQWQMKIERAEYEAKLAERRHEEVDPSNRIVASTLEKRWNDALLRLETVKQECADAQKKSGLAITEEQRAKVMALAEDFSRLWNAATTKTKDRKRMLRLLIKDITVDKAEKKLVVLHIRWQGGACEDIRITLPPSVMDRIRYGGEMVDRVRELAQHLNDPQIAHALDEEGRRPSKSDKFTPAIVSWIRHKHRIPSPDLRRPEERTVKQVAAQFDVSPGVVYYWIDRSVIEPRRKDGGSPYWITLSQQKEDELRAWVRNSKRIQNQRKKSEAAL